MTKQDQTNAKSRRRWHYQPVQPVSVSPLFTMPLKPLAIVKWFLKGWLPCSEKLIVLGLSILCWIWFHPTLQQAGQIESGWVSMILVRNLCLMFLVAGGLHLYLYIWRAQGDDLHYDTRPFRKNSRVFLFNDQVRDNMFWSCASGVTIWTGFEVLMMWGLANGYAPGVTWQAHPGWIILMIFLIPIWETFYFYLIHRALHWPWLYKHVHYLHHKNTNVGPWSGLSMHPIEHLIYLGSVCVHWIVPSNPLIIIFHLQFYALTAATTHAGYRGIIIKKILGLPLGTFHHQIHHRYFECNYGGLEIPWDKWMGSFNDGSDESHEHFIEQQRKKLNQSN